MPAPLEPDNLTPPVAASSITLGLESKFNPPAHDASQVARAGLCETICRGAGQLVLVRAPAGFGKTTAMMQARVRLEDAGGPPPG